MVEGFLFLCPVCGDVEMVIPEDTGKLECPACHYFMDPPPEVTQDG